MNRLGRNMSSRNPLLYSWNIFRKGNFEMVTSQRSIFLVPHAVNFFLRLRQFAEADVLVFVLCSFTSNIPRISNKMVSLLWKACSEGDLEKVQELLKEPNGVDIELKGE
jgi:hypothetical protein